MLTAQHRSAPPSPEVSEAYLAVYEWDIAEATRILGDIGYPL